MKGKVCLDLNSNSCLLLSPNLSDGRMIRQNITMACLPYISLDATSDGTSIEACATGYCYFQDKLGVDINGVPIF